MSEADLIKRIDKVASTTKPAKQTSMTQAFEKAAAKVVEQYKK